MTNYSFNKRSANTFYIPGKENLFDFMLGNHNLMHIVSSHASALKVVTLDYSLAYRLLLNIISFISLFLFDVTWKGSTQSSSRPVSHRISSVLTGWRAAHSHPPQHNSNSCGKGNSFRLVSDGTKKKKIACWFPSIYHDLE